MNRLKPEKEQQVVDALKQSSYCLRGIARDTGVSRNTIRKIETKVILRPDNNFKMTHLR